MSLRHLLGAWTSRLPQIYDTLVQCVFDGGSQSKAQTFCVEVAGSGAVLGRYTHLELQGLLKTHQLFVGHGGSKISDVRQISQTFQGPIVALKIVFRGVLYETLKTISDNVTWVVWSPDSQRILGGMDDGTLMLWRKRNNCFVPKILETQNLVCSIAWHPSGHTFASCSNANIQLWTADGEITQRLKFQPQRMFCLTWSPDGKILAGGSENDSIMLWVEDKDGFSVQTLEEHTSSVFCVAWSPDGQTLASGSYDCTIKLWRNNEDGIFLTQTIQVERPVLDITWNPDDQTFVSCSFPRLIMFWNKEGELLQVLEGHLKQVICVAWSPNGKILASGSKDRTIKLWNKDGELIKTLEGHTETVNCIAWSLDGTTLASGSWDTTIKLWK